MQWIFDAKYRIADNSNGTDSDKAPDEAINQMHRYRDALIYINQANDGELEKSRPILGAFVLYPGWFDEADTSNPYQDAIEAVGIGGFPLLRGGPISVYGIFWKHGLAIPPKSHIPYRSRINIL